MSRTRTPLPFDVEQVTALVEQVGRDVVLPRFRNLGRHDVERKVTPGFLEDLVTVVDTEAEAAIGAGLRQIVDTHVVGEEATHAEEGLVDCLASEAPAWVVDPIDGTANFVAGHDGFGIMVAYIVAGRTEAAWVHLPARRETFAAVAGCGVRLNGQLITTKPVTPAEPLQGSLFVRFMPDDLREQTLALCRNRYVEAEHAGAAAVEYTDVLRGRKDFVVYYRLHPWDHAAPALLLCEAGGRVDHLDGTPYTVRSPNQLTVGARSAEIARNVRGWFASHKPNVG